MLTDIYEIVGFVTGILCVYLVVKQSIWNWPIALVNAAFYTIVFYQARLYADMGLQVIYFLLSLYGWYEWLYGGKNKTRLTVSRISFVEGLILSVLGSTGTLSLGYFLSRYSNADLPYWDAGTAAFSLCAQFLMARKKIENWILWILVDIIYIGMYFYKQLFLTMVLYSVFLILAVMGFFAWYQSLRQMRSQNFITTQTREAL